MRQRAMRSPEIVQCDLYAAFAQQLDLSTNNRGAPAERYVLVHLEDKMVERHIRAAEALLHLADQIAGAEIRHRDVHADLSNRNAGIKPAPHIARDNRQHQAREL